MNIVRILYLDKLILRARESSQDENFNSAWRLLEDAHVLSQPYASYHTYVHWEMLKLAVHERNWREILGQVLRLFIAAPGSWSGRYPYGNTGRSNVNMFLPMEIQGKLQEKMKKLDREEAARIESGGQIEKKESAVIIRRKSKKVQRF